jgi:hypothetical protein
MVMRPTGWSLNPVLPTPRVTTLYRAKVVIYDLKKDIRYTLTQHWDRSVDELAVRLGIIIVFREKRLMFRSSPRNLIFFT